MPELKATTCSRCDTVNGPTSKFCSRCSMTMDIQTAQSVEQEKSDIALKLMALIEKCKCYKKHRQYCNTARNMDGT